jgi:hypothetical protein
MNKLTIQINNLEALERLIGGDSEVEIEIRNSVVQNFAEKHLKPLANSASITSTLSDIKKDILKLIKEKCEKDIATFHTTWCGSTSEIKLSPAIQSEIDCQVRNIVDEKIRNITDEAIKFWSSETEIKKRIEKRFEYYTTEMINTEIKSRIEKLKAKL